MKKILTTFSCALIGVLPCSIPAAENPLSIVVPLHGGETSDAFVPVLQRLDLGGPVFFYVDLEEDALELARKLEPVFSFLQEMGSPIPPIPIDAESIVREANLNGLRALGISSVRHEGLFRNRVFMYLPEGREGFFRFLGGESRPFAGLRYAPPETSYFYEVEYDVPALVETLKDISRVVMGDAGPNMISSALEEPIEFGTETVYGDLVMALQGRASLAISLDREARTPLPEGGGSLPGIDFFVRLEKLAPILETFLTNEPAFESLAKNGMPAFRSLDPIDPDFFDKRPFVVLDGENVLFASSESYFDGVVGQGENHLGNDPSFQAALDALGGAEGNQIEFVRPEVYDEMRALIESMGIEGETGWLSSFLSHWLPEVDRPTVSVRRNLDDGILVHSELPVSHKSSLASAGVAPLAMLAAMAIPAYHRVGEASLESMIDNDARYLASAAQQYFFEHDTTTVELEYNPNTGELSGPLAEYVFYLSPGYTTFPEVITDQETFVLGHPDIPHSREYSSDGHYLGPVSSWP